MLHTIKTSKPALASVLFIIWSANASSNLLAQDATPTDKKSSDVAPEVVSINDAAHSSVLFDAEAPSPLATPAGMDPTPQPKAAPAKPSQNVTINLINRLVQRGVLTQADATDLIAQAQADAERAKAEAQPDDGLEIEGDTVRVTYVPETVKTEIREQLKDMVLSQAKDEGWANPKTQPEWVSRFKMFGDVRLRYDGTFFPEGNDNTGSFPNFNAINTGSPFDVSGTQFSPQHNVDQERNRLRLRARLGVDVNLEGGFTGGIRIATGENNSPVSTNQTLGVANQAQGGNFSKYSLWLDRGFIKYEIGGEANFNVAFLFGRFDNPFFTASDIVWDDDVGFDGVAVQAKFPLHEGINFFLNAGAFPIFNTDFNFSSNQPAKFESEDKWLYAGQVGFDLKPNKDFNAKIAAAYYDFNKVEGRRSTPYIPLTSQDASDADNSRPSYAQKGNTYMAIRDIIPSALNNFGTTQQFQYFGLASPFKVAVYSARLDFNHFEPFQVSLLGEYAVNTDFDNDAINASAVNNRGPLPVDDSGVPTGVGDYAGGNTAWNVNLIVGKSAFEKAGDWNASFGYRYIESDAVVDAFTDSDFNVGGTNVEGYTIGAAVALSPRVKLSLRWMSATQIAGPPLKSDVVLLDLNAKF
ncbi:putative porin [soil metagenome]